MKPRLSLTLSLMLLIAFLALVIYQSNTSPVEETNEHASSSTAAKSDRSKIVAPTAAPTAGHRAEDTTVQPAGKFSPEMARVVRAIHRGQSVQIQEGDEARDYIFRPKRVTTDEFNISAGPDAVHPASFEVFEGYQVLPNGRLVEMAKMAVVNDTLSMIYSTEKGQFLIEQNDAGQWISKTLMGREEGSTWGHWQCASTPELASITVLDNEGPRTETEVEISIAAETSDEPEIAEARVAHPFFRLGAEYDASLKDLAALMVSSKSQTGNSSNLNSRAASYFSYAATLGDIYERQLGMRFRLQELILIPSDSDADNFDPPADDANADLEALRTWTGTHRPRSTYQWGHVMGWSNVGGSGGGTIGRAWLNSYGSSSFGFSVNERNWDWRVLAHELGHNVGAGHTNGGVMNSSIRTSEDFFRENARTGGFTAARDIYNTMSSPTRAFVEGPAPLRHPDEMPFGVDDDVSTGTDTPVTFDPLANDLNATPLFGQTNTVLSLVEVGQVFPKSAGTATVSNGEILFDPAAGFSGRAWLTYTLRGNVGNNGEGWLHSADVVVTVGGNTTNPSQNPSISVTDDVVETDFSLPIRINPLLNDEGKGRLWASDVDAVNFANGSLVTRDGAFHLVNATVIVGNGSLTLETADMTLNGANTQVNTGYLVYTPGNNEPDQVEIQYTAEDANGTQSTGMIYLNFIGSVSVATDPTELAEPEGRVATVTFTRSGSTSADEWVDFSLSGTVDLTGPDSDVAIAGFDHFDPFAGTGRVTIPAGQSSAELTVSAMDDALVEDAESLNIAITDVQSLLIHGIDNEASIDVIDNGEATPIDTVLANENFDSFPIGSNLANGWTNAAGQPGVWTAGSGETSSSGTGPANDHTQGTESNIYLYREASGNSNQRADLISPTIDLSSLGEATVEFYYHMYGSDMGELRVDVFSGGSWNLDVMPVLSGEQQSSSEEAWKLARINVSPWTTADFRIRFRGITGRGFRSDMAIDDFAVGEAAPPPPQAPVIISQPQSQTVDVNDPVYLSVVAEASPSPSYQWKKNGVILSGATRSVYVIPAAQGTDSGDYTCEVTSGSTVTSATATVTLPLKADAGPDQTVIDTNNSGSAMITLDGSASFDPGGTIVSYIWNDGTNDIATGATPSISLPRGTHTITLTVTDNDGNTDTDSVVIVVRPPISANGGTFELVGNYYVHTFTGGPADFEVFEGITLEVDVLVVGGGGGGGSSTSFSNAGGGGGGAGGLIYQEGIQVTGSVGVVVGTPGAGGGNGNLPGSDGGNSAFGSLVALGGGGGSGGNMQGRAGGSGGGSRGNSNGGAGQQPTSASGGFGNSGGGWGSSGGDGAGGGGGAGAAAASAPPLNPSTGGPGGIGRSYDISGESIYYAGGGGGGGAGTTAIGQGGNGGGGNGGNNNIAPTAGATNTGGGGGGGNNSRVGAPGGSGIVIVRYLASTVQEDAFTQWAAIGGGGGDITFTGDANGDGIADGMAWLLGAEEPAQNANGLLPLAEENTGDLTLSFKMLNSSSRGIAVLSLEYSYDLGVTDPWTENTIPIPDESGTVGGVVFTIIPIEGTDHNQVQATLPASATGGTGKLFARIKGVLSP